MSKPSQAERQYVRVLHERMAAGELRCVVTGEMATDLHHPRYPQSLWECGTGLKAHDWFVIPLSRQAHDDFHRFGAQTWQKVRGSHKKLLKSFWRSMGLEPGDYMTVGMEPKRAEWFNRVLTRVMEPDSKYEKAVYGVTTP